MKAPDKIYVVPDFIEGLSLERKDFDDEVCYIRKDALLEWLNRMLEISAQSLEFQRNYAYGKVIDKLNSM